MDTTFTFKLDQFNRFFPFYLLIDENMVIESCGKTMEKLVPSCLGNRFDLNFSMKRPEKPNLSFQDFKLFTDQVVVIDSNTSQCITFRGQVEYQSETNHYLLLLSPWFDSMEKVLESNLVLDDFALHDPMIDLLYVLKTHEITTMDMKHLFSKLNLQKNELKKLSLIAEETLNGVIVTDAEGRIEWINKGFFNITGYTLDDVIGKKPGQILQGKDTSRETVNYLRTQIRNQKPFACEILNYNKSGSPYWIRITGQPLFDKSGKVVQFFAIEEDITKEKRAKEMVEESEERLSALVLNLQTGILLEDEKRKLLLINKQFCKMFGIDAPPESLKGIPCGEAAEASKKLFKDPEGFIDGINKLLTEKKHFIGEELELSDGRIFERSYIPIYYSKKYRGHLWSYDDVTLKKNYQKNLQAQKEKYSNIIANMNLGLFEVDNNDVILLANQSFCEMSGYSLEELIGKKASDLLLLPESKETLKEQSSQRKKGISDSYEIKVRIKNGKKRYWLVSGAPSYDEKGRLVGTIGIHLDITHQKKLESQKEKLVKNLAIQNEQLNEYAHIVSHDLKSPLRNISALLSWTMEDFKERLGGKSMTNLNLMQDRVEKMDNLIGNILKYSSIDKMHVQNENINLNNLVNSIIDMIYIPAHVVVNIKSKLPEIIADETRIQQLFQNLISNAVNYNDKEKGRVEIDYYEEKLFHRFSVHDNGVGIAQEHHNKIFKIFNSLESKNNNSSGVGLSIVKKIVDFYHGKIWLESKPGEGTTFFFTIRK